MKTINGVYNNIRESEYYEDIEGIRFYFSSNFYKNKFKNEVLDFILDETAKINNKYKLCINLKKYFLIAYYMRVEKRGFFVINLKTNKEIFSNKLFELKED